MEIKIDSDLKETIKIVIDNDTLKKYNKYYFKKYPRRKKEPITKPVPISLNEWVNAMIKQQSNTIKQQWKDFVVWLIEDYGLTNKSIKKCCIEYHFYFSTHHRRDCDNYTPKFIQDGLVASGIVIEDNFNVINPILLSCHVDKKHTRTEIIIKVIE